MKTPSPFTAARRPRAAPQRRSLLLGALGLALGLGACTESGGPTFHGMDITGADYGRDFDLLDADGQRRTLADFRGQVVMLFFGFTQCPDVCPTALARAAEVRQQLGAQAPKLQVLFVTIDPERDTPAVLKAYTAAFDPGFVGLYGDLPRTAATARDFKAFYAKVPTGSSYTMDHSALTYVFDPKGRLRLALRHTQNASEFTADVRTLMGAG